MVRYSISDLIYKLDKIGREIISNYGPSHNLYWVDKIASILET